MRSVDKEMMKVLKEAYKEEDLDKLNKLAFSLHDKDLKRLHETYVKRIIIRKRKNENVI